MQATMKDGNANFALAQFQYALGDSEIETKIDTKWICDKIEDLNCKISATPYLQMNKKELIGDTALHLAATNKDLDAFYILLNLGVDFTVKNNNNMTALHKIIEHNETLILEKCILDDVFINLILSAHLKHHNFENPSNNSELSHFHVACAANNVEVVQGFLSNGVLIDKFVKRDCSLFSGFSPLHFAARYCALEVMEVLLLGGANIHAKDNKGMMSLHVALERRLKIMGKVDVDELARNKNEKILQLFLEKETNKETMLLDSWGLSHLHVACTLQDSKVADSLLNKVTDINQAVNMDSPLWPGYTALHFAMYCNIDAVKLLMIWGADISIKDAKGVTPYDIFIEKYKAEDIHEILYLHPLWKDIMLADGKTKLIDFIFLMKDPHQLNEFLENFCKNFNVPYTLIWPGYTQVDLNILLFSLVAKVFSDVNREDGYFEKLCKQSPIMFHSKDIHDYTPFHLSFRQNKKLVLDLLLEFSEVYSQLSDYVDEEGLSLVHIACAQNKVDVLKRLLAVGSNVNAVYKGKSLILPLVCSGSTPLHLAVVNGSVSAVKMLMKEGADVYAKDANGMTPIHLLLLNNAASILLSSLNLRDSVVRGIELSHLHVACLWDDPETVEKLLNIGADINSIITYSANKNEGTSHLSFLEKYAGYSPLIVAYENNKYNVVKLLLKRGADIFVDDTKGKPLVCSIFGDECDSRLASFVKVLKENEDLQNCLKIKTGMSELHLACLFNDSETIEKLLAKGANVNEQIRFESPILQGYTPLHIVAYMTDEYDAEKTMKLLVEKGADVTLANAASDTAVHLAYERLPKSAEVKIYRYINILLDAQRDFSMNPVNISGLTHFHLACRVSNMSAVQEFLRYAEIDINKQIDFFHDDEPGYTALHLALMAETKERYVVVKQLGIVDILLKYRASVHVVDVYGDTPIQNCFRFDNHSRSLDLFERIARAGADVNTRNLDGNTPLYYYLYSDAITSDGIKALLRMGCRLNTFNNLTNHGYIGQIPRALKNDDLLQLIFTLSVNYTQEMKADDFGRTLIHNLVSNTEADNSENEYSIVIEQLSGMVCDIDDQDELGRTALHMAVKFYNHEAISGLLMTGADIDLRDKDGKIAFAHEFDSCTACDEFSESDEETHKHRETLEVLATHVKKLQLCGLEVDKENIDLACKALVKLQSVNPMDEKFFKELDVAKSSIIEHSQSLALSNFLSETGAVARYPRMSSLQRKAVNKFFSSYEVESLRDQYPELAGILQLQYRKARARPQLMESARDSLTVVVGFRMPEICSDYILILLTNSELKILTASTM